MAALKSWQRMFAGAALFNFAIGVPIMAAASWTFQIAYGPTGGAADPTVLMFWRDFGFTVVLIGVGYLMVATHPHRHRGIVWLGIAAKLFDVVVLTWRWSLGLADAVALVPAAVDGGFAMLFAVYLYRVRAVDTTIATHASPSPERRA